MSQKTPTEIAAALKAAADRKAYVAECRKKFETTPNIYAIEYVYRIAGWALPDKHGRSMPYSVLTRKRDPMPRFCAGALDVFVPYWKVRGGVMVAILDGFDLRFGISICDRADRFSKYIGLATAIGRAHDGGNLLRGSVFFHEFIARQRDRLVASRNRKLYGNEAGEVSITARGDTRIEVRGSGNQVVVTGGSHAVSMTRRVEVKE